MRKIITGLFFASFLLIFFVKLTETASAAQTITTNPNAVTGGTVMITIENPETKGYSLHIFASATGYNDTKLRAAVDVDDNGNCALKTINQYQYFAIVSCNTTKLDINLDVTASGLITPGMDLEYTIQLLRNGAPTYNTGKFVVKGGPSTASFTIDSVDPNPIIPGEDIVITLKNNVVGEYKYGFQGESLGSGYNTMKKKKCENAGQCDFTIEVPKDFKDLTEASATLTVTHDSEVVTMSLAIDQSGQITDPKHRPADPPPCADWVDGQCQSVATGLGFNLGTNAASFIKSLFSLVLGLSGGIALLLIIISGYKLMLARGNPEKMQGVKESLTAAIVGLLFIIFSVAVLEILGVDILKLPSFSREPGASTSATSNSNRYVCNNINHTCSIGTGNSTYIDLNTCNKACASVTCASEQNKRINSGCTCGAVDSLSNCPTNKKIVGLYNSNGQACMIDCCCPK